MNATEAVAHAASMFEAQLIVGMLKAHGLAAGIVGDDAGGQEPQWQLVAGIRVMVAAEDAARARALLDDVQ